LPLATDKYGNTSALWDNVDVFQNISDLAKGNLTTDVIKKQAVIRHRQWRKYRQAFGSKE
jgi:hypothetical protein